MNLEVVLLTDSFNSFSQMFLTIYYVQTAIGYYSKNRDKLDMDTTYEALNIWW